MPVRIFDPSFSFLSEEIPPFLHTPLKINKQIFAIPTEVLIQVSPDFIRGHPPVFLPFWKRASTRPLIQGMCHVLVFFLPRLQSPPLMDKAHT